MPLHSLALPFTNSMNTFRLINYTNYTISIRYMQFGIIWYVQFDLKQIRRDISSGLGKQAVPISKYHSSSRYVSMTGDDVMSQYPF